MIVVDDVEMNSYIKEFVTTFSMILSADLNVFLIMTGLYKNISRLEHNKGMTFLVRAPKIQIEPLSENRITRAYEQLLEVPTSEAREMARFTKGYPFGYQVLGNIIFQNHYTLQEAVPDFDDYIQDYSYDLTWSELLQPTVRYY